MAPQSPNPPPFTESVGQPEEATQEEQPEEAVGTEEPSAGEERPEEGDEAAAEVEAEAGGHLEELPEQLLLRVLAELPGSELVQACRLVCLRWKELVDGAPLWLLKCQQEGLVAEGTEEERDHWQQFYFLSKRRRNLLRNPCGEGECGVCMRCVCVMNPRNPQEYNWPWVPLPIMLSKPHWSWVQMFLYPQIQPLSCRSC